MPAIGDQAGQRTARRFEVPRQRRSLVWQRAERAGDRRLGGKPGRERLLIEVVQVLGKLVDDLRLAGDGQRRQVRTNVRLEVHRGHPIGSRRATRCSADNSSCQLARCSIRIFFPAGDSL